MPDLQREEPANGAGDVLKKETPVRRAEAGFGSAVASSAPLWIGAAVLVIYVVFIYSLLRNVGTANETIWARSLYLFSGIETIAFAAAGFFFGREVNRARAENAENRAETEAERAARLQREAAESKTKGQVLTRMLRDLADAEGVAYGAPPREALGGAPPRTSALRQLAREAERLFPGA